MKKEFIIKVCGMRKPDNIKEILNLDINMMGFIFYRSSPRSAQLIPERINFNTTSKVGVFVDASLNEVVKKAMSFHLDYLQLHGKESPEYCMNLKKYEKKIIKAFSIDIDFDFGLCMNYLNAADYFLFDTKGKLKGGNGKIFDWNILKRYNLNKPFLLSGGISPEHLQEIKKFTHPQFAGIDINSGFEIKPGIKNYKKLKHFIHELRN